MIHQGDCLAVLKTLPAESVQMVVTSPPYWGLRDYGHAGQIGMEGTPEAFTEALVTVFAEVSRVLRKDGVCWLNLGDSYCSQGGLHDGRDDNQPNVGASRVWRNGSGRADGIVDERGQRNRNGNTVLGLKPKDLVGIPWRVAFAMQAAGWYLRSDIIWSKPNPMPESVQDRPTKAHEYIFLLTKSARYYYNADAIREPYSESTLKDFGAVYESEGTKDYAASGVQNPSAVKKRIKDKQRGHGRRHAGFNDRWDASVENKSQYAAANIPGQSPHGYTQREDGLTSMAPLGGANKRSVWTVATQPFPGAHFATFPEALIEPCILAGSKQGDVVLDPFCGAGTVGVVCAKAQRQFIGIELNPEYVAMANERIASVAPLFQEVS